MTLVTLSKRSFACLKTLGNKPYEDWERFESCHAKRVYATGVTSDIKHSVTNPENSWLLALEVKKVK